MPLAGKTRLGPYEVIAPLGAGGMGEVYEARDTRLDRTVAIKICKGKFTERFEREARAISSLNHPHICALYDIGHEAEVEFLVMEHLEGETLEDRLRKGPLPIDEALDIAIQIASALDAAHRKGIIHRDLKPANVMLTRAGAKLLDFGLSKISEPVLSGSNASMLTAAQPITREGTIVGTFQYMSPEQLEGKETDARSDIFSFGAMLYEMVTGRKSFEGSSHASLIAAVMSSNPPLVSTLQPMASPALDRIVRSSLAKSPDDRWQSAGDLKSELEWIAEGGSKAGVPAPVAARRHNRERLAWILAGLAAALLLASLAAVYIQKKPAEPAEVRFQIPVPNNLNFYWYHLPVVSPDGERIAFIAAADTLSNDRLFVRPLNAETATEIPLPGDDPYYPFWSPDGRQIAFFSRRTLKKVDVSGGSPVTICPITSNGSGATWNRDGVIIFAQAPSLLYRVNAAGGEPKPLRSLAEGETSQRWAQFLPDGKHYLYLSISDRPDQQGIYAGSLDSNERKFIVATNAQAVYVEPGQLLFARGDVLMAQPFDLRNLTLQGEPRQVADHIERTDASGPVQGAVFSASPNGVIAWRRASQSPGSVLQWVDRRGRKLGIVGEPADYSNPALSPDNRRVAIGIRDPQTKMRDIWIFDLLRGTKTRLTFDPADDLDSIWSPDGTRITFTSNRAGQRDIYQTPADGSGSAVLLLGGKGGQKNVEDWSMDGRYLVYNYQTANPTRISLYVLPLTGDRKPMPFVDTGFTTQQGQLSPNGQWMAYRSLESGKSEIYVQGFTLDSSQPRGKWQISTNGGELPRWRRDGKELFYHQGNTFYAVDVKTDGASFEAGIPRPLFDTTTAANSNGITGGAPYVVSSDGQRLMTLAPFDKLGNEPLQVVVNWR
jgi:eukaryotic-like serine/threonine-protein kinase